MIKNIITAAITSIVVSVLALSFVPTKTTVVQAPAQNNNTLGSAMETIRVTFGQGFDALSSVITGNLTNRGINTYATTSTAVTLTASQIVGYSTFSVTPGGATLQMTLPASSTFPLSFLPRSGDRTQFVLLNSTTSAAAVGLGWAAGTGSLLEVASTTSGVGTATTTSGKAAVVNVIRKPNTDLIFTVQPFF